MEARGLKATVLIVVFISVFLKITLLPFAQVVDADAVTRIFMAQEWWGNPVWISEGVWPPLHQYFYGFIVGITGDHQSTPILISILLSSLAAVPMFQFIRREFNEKAAFWIALALVLSPVLFRNSFHTLSGTPFVLLLLLSMNALTKSWRNGNVKSAIWAGVFMTLACGFRYEGWMLFAVFTGFGVLQRAWKTTAVFWIIGMIFPAFWMVGNYLAHQDFFFGLSGAYDWNVIQEGVNSYLPRDIMLLRWFFFPASWFFLFSPILAIALMIGLFKLLRAKHFDWKKWRWGCVFILLMIVFVYKSHNGTLLNQHRFTGTLIVFSLPMLALLWDLPSKRLIQMCKIGVVSLLPLSFVWGKFNYAQLFSEGSSTHYALDHFYGISKQGLAAIPRLKNQNIRRVEKMVVENVSESSGLVVDFIDWESSYYIALESGIDKRRLFLVNGARNAELDLYNLRQTIESCRKGLIVLHKGSKLSEYFSNPHEDWVQKLKIEQLSRIQNVTIVRFESTNE